MEIYWKKWHLPTCLIKYIAIRIPNFMKLGQISNDSWGESFLGMTMIIFSHVLSMQRETKN